MPIVALAVTLAASPGDPALFQLYQERFERRLVPLISEVVRFPTVAGDAKAFADQRAWIHRVGIELGFAVRDTPTMTEVELPGPAGAPVLGLMVHGDVQPVDAREWKDPPFSGAVRDGAIWGRGTADDKGPLVQALLAMASLRTSPRARTHTLRLLVGTDEESGSKDVRTYLEDHPAPAMTLVLDSEFPVVVGEKAWSALQVTAPSHRPGGTASPLPYAVTGLTAGLAPSIVPDRAELKLRWSSGAPDWEPLLSKLRGRPLPPGTSLQMEGEGAERTVRVRGRAAHSGVALRSGRNALVALAGLVDGLLPPCGAADLLDFAALAGRDLQGTGLGLPAPDPAWHGTDVNVAMVTPGTDGTLALVVNLRSPPVLSGAALAKHLDARVQAFSALRGAGLTSGGFFGDTPLVLDPKAPLIVRLEEAYARATGTRPVPVYSGGGTYAKRIPRSVAFGMWFPGTPYPGHAADERVPIASLHLGVRVLLEALSDLAYGPPMENPLG